MEYSCGQYGGQCGYSAACSEGYSSMQQYSALESAVGQYNPISNPTMRMSKDNADSSNTATANSLSSHALFSHDFHDFNNFNPKNGYSSAAGSSQYSQGLYIDSGKTAHMHFSPSQFINPNEPTEFISSGDSMQEALVLGITKEAFEAAAGKKLPGDISINLCNEQAMKKIHELHGGKWSPGIRGFSLNRRGFGISEIFVQEDELARLMLTIGHEIGHVLSLPMKDPVDEEAKAFAFSLAWMKAVRENNIGGLHKSIIPEPAKNGLHNRAFEFVVEMMRMGREAIEVYIELIRGEISTGSLIISTAGDYQPGNY